MWQHQEASSALVYLQTTLQLKYNIVIMPLCISLWLGTENCILHINRHNVHNFLYEPGGVQHPFSPSCSRIDGKPSRTSELEEDEGFSDWSQKLEQRKQRWGGEGVQEGDQIHQGECREAQQAEPIQGEER